MNQYIVNMVIKIDLTVAGCLNCGRSKLKKSDLRSKVGTDAKGICEYLEYLEQPIILYTK